MKRFLLLLLSIIFSLLIIFTAPLAISTKPFLPFVNYLLGVEKPTSYLVLLGNDAEMRANGGFAGSYSKIIMNYPDISVDFQDIYVPNGQLKGHVDPPEPIQQAFGHGTWELANADWEPDFPTSATALRWFFEKGKEINPDNLVLVNLTTIKKVLDIAGPFYVSQYEATLTPENLYLFLQGKAEVNFFPGSTQKKDALSAVGQALIKKIQSLPTHKKIKIAHILLTDFQNQNIMIHSSNDSFQKLLVKQKMAGVLEPVAFDTYSLIETNLGANKANLFVTRDTRHEISVISSKQSDLTSSNKFIHHQVTVQFTNTSPEANPNPPIHYGGDYIAFLRLYIPTTAQNIQVSQNPKSSSQFPEHFLVNTGKIPESVQINPKYNFTEVGFWHTTHAGSESSIALSYDLPLSKIDDYSLAILKQHGLRTSPQSINLFGKTFSTDLHSNLW